MSIPGQLPSAVNNPLQGLHDIHLPADPHWWPLAPGWWIIISVLVMTFFVFFFLKWRKYRWQRTVLAEIEHIIRTQETDRSSQLAKLSALLRRVSLRRFPQDEVANLYGQEWLQFLQMNISDKKMNLSIIDPLANEIYQNQQSNAPLKIDDPLVQFVQKWIRENLI